MSDALASDTRVCSELRRRRRARNPRARNGQPSIGGVTRSGPHPSSPAPPVAVAPQWSSATVTLACCAMLRLVVVVQAAALLVTAQFRPTTTVSSFPGAIEVQEYRWVGSASDNVFAITTNGQLWRASSHFQNWQWTNETAKLGSAVLSGGVRSLASLQLTAAFSGSQFACGAVSSSRP